MKHSRLITIMVAFIIFGSVGGVYWALINTQNQQTIPVIEIIRNPASWVNQTVTVRGILAILPQVSPTRYALYPGNQSTLLYVQWDSNSTGVPNSINTGITATVQGIIKEKIWVNPQHLIPSPDNNQFQPAPGTVVYYIEAEKVDLLGPTEHVP